MEFDKSRVYTALNADELPIGSKCVFADNLRELRRLVSIEDTSQVLIAIKGESYKYRFEQAKADCMGDTLFALAYLIEPPAEPKYKPFESFNNMADAAEKHGNDIEAKTGKCKGCIVGMGLKGHVIINGMFGMYYFCSTKELFEDYVFADDGSPCGELVEE